MRVRLRRFNVFDLSRRLKERGWLVPAYTLPEHREDLAVLRVVCRNGFTHDLASMFLRDLSAALPELQGQEAPRTPPRPPPPSTIEDFIPVSGQTEFRSTYS